MPEKELTYGERAVGLTFNPSNDPTVQKIKELYAEIIDLVNQIPCASPSERMRLIKIAITEAQGAQMWAVKAATWQEAVLAEAGKEEGNKPETLEEAISKDEAAEGKDTATPAETPIETETPAAEVPEGEEGEKQE